MERTSKKQTGWLLRVLVIGLLMWLGWAEGTPVAAADTVSIGTAAQLIDFANRVNTGETTLNGVLTADIELNKAINDDDTTNWSHWGETSPPDGLVPWTPIGIPTNRYTGSFDGAGHTVSGIYINAPSVTYQGLFGNVKSGATISNLGVIESYISGKNITGGVAGFMYGTISNCFNRGTVIGDTRVGGVAGTANSVINSYNTGSVSGNDFVGGVTGLGVDLINSYNSGKVSGNFCVGGVIGRQNAMDPDGQTSVSNCYNAGDVTVIDATSLSSENVGGVAGSTERINNSYNTGRVNGTKSVGGVVGKTPSIKNSFNSGTVTGTDDVGQIAGYEVAAPAASNCYYLAGEAATGIGNGGVDVAGHTEFKSPAAFASGEVAWRLQEGQPDPTVAVWGQALGDGGEALPLLKTTAPVYRLTLKKGDDSLYSQTYRNAVATSLPDIAGISWKDADKNLYAEITEAGDYTLYPWLTAAPTPEPMATVVYGTKLRDIILSSDSDPVSNWRWNWPAEDQDQILAVGNDRGFSARYRASDGLLAIFEADIVPEITPRSLNEVSISQPPNVVYSGTALEPPITVADSGAVITADDYIVTYSNNTSPGTATVTISGQGNYLGTVTRNFTITSGGGGGYTPPALSGISVTPQHISFDPSGQIAVDISGLPAAATVYYSLDGISYSTTPPAITRAGEHQLYLRISSPGYQDYTTQTTVTVAKQSPPQVSPIELPLPPQQQQPYTLLLGSGLPADRGLTQYQVGLIDDPGGLLDGPPIIAADGSMTCNFRRPLQTAADATTGPAEAALTGGADGLATAAPTVTITVLVTMENYQDTSLTVVVGEAAAFAGLLTLAADNQHYFYQYDDLNYSYLAAQLQPASATARMYQHFVDHHGQVVAYKDPYQGYLDYQALQAAYLQAQLSGQVFVLADYGASPEAVAYDGSVTAIRIVNRAGQISGD